MQSPSPRVSVDSHFSEPEDLWSSRLPEEMRYRAPAYKRVGKSKLWVVNGRNSSKTDEYMRYRRDGELVAVPPLRAEELGAVGEPIDRDDIEGRLRDLDADGVWAETIHPNVGLLLMELEDKEYVARCAEVYNDYIAERFQSDRLYPNALIPLQDLDWAVKEINRVAGMGIHGLEMQLCAPRGRPYYLDMYDPIWSAAQDCGLPIAMHAGTGKSGHTAVRAEEMQATYSAGTDPVNREHSVFAKRTAMAAAGISAGAYQCFETIPHLVAGGVLERFPDLHFVIVETGASWLLYLLDSMDTAWTGLTVQRDVLRTFFRPDGSPVAQSGDDEVFRTWPYPLLPSEYVKRQMHVGFMDDFVALRNRELTGVDSLVWGNDYPHYEGTWPNSDAAIAAQADRAHLNEDERAAIFGGTIAKLYKMRLPATV